MLNRPRFASLLRLGFASLFLSAAASAQTIVNGIVYVGNRPDATHTGTSPVNLTTPRTVNGVYVGSTSSSTIARANIYNSNALVVNGDFHLAAVADTHASVTVTSSGTPLKVNGSLYIGENGYGEFVVNSTTNPVNAYADYVSVGHNNGATGRLVVRNKGVLHITGDYLDIGTDGDGEAVIYDGGTVNAPYVTVGWTNTGTLDIEGPGSSLNASGEVWIGYYGSGTATVSDGAALNVTGSDTGTEYYLALGLESGSDGSLVVDGGTVNVRDYFDVGANGQGSLEVISGGQVTTGTLTIGRQSGSGGNVTVSGADSWIDLSSDLVISSESGSQGTLTVESHGEVYAAGNIHVGTDSGTHGTVLVTGTNARLETESSLFIGGAGAGHVTVASGGAILADEHAFVRANGTLHVASGGAVFGGVTLQNGGTLTGTGSVDQLTVSSGGILAPGDGIGAVQAGNTIFAANGRFRWQLDNANGSAGPNWDLLSISGTLTLTATAANPFVLDLASLTTLDANGLAENFDPLSGYTFTFLAAVGGIIGFSNDKFSFDDSDFLNPFTGTWSVALVNADHSLALNYTPAGSAIPEPSAYALVFGSAALVFAAWRERSRSKNTAHARA